MIFRFGATLELGRSERTTMRPLLRPRWSYGVIAKVRHRKISAREFAAEGNANAVKLLARERHKKKRTMTVEHKPQPRRTMTVAVEHKPQPRRTVTVEVERSK